jgi:hypothetical protein
VFAGNRRDAKTVPDVLRDLFKCQLTDRSRINPSVTIRDRNVFQEEEHSLRSKRTRVPPPHPDRRPEKAYWRRCTEGRGALWRGTDCTKMSRKIPSLSDLT